MRKQHKKANMDLKFGLGASKQNTKINLKDSFKR